MSSSKPPKPSKAQIVSLTDGKITAGSLGVGQYIRSTSYTAGSTGWAINADGTAEFGSATIRRAGQRRLRQLLCALWRDAATAVFMLNRRL